jgi:hypothetical protein
LVTVGNSFKLPLYYIFLGDTKYMTILTRQERERLVLDLYKQGKTYAKYLRRQEYLHVIWDIRPKT